MPVEEVEVSYVHKMLLNDNFVGTTLSTGKKKSVQLQFVKTNSQIVIIFHFNRIISIKMIFLLRI